jgi:hypothetical protein
MPRKPPPTIDELAVKHVLRHKNDKSDRYVAQMNRRFGRTATTKAVTQAEQINRMLTSI